MGDHEKKQLELVFEDQRTTNKLNINWFEVDNAIKMIVRYYESWNRNRFPLVNIIAVSRGGLIPATILSHKLGLPISHVIHMSSYEGTEQKHTINDPIITPIGKPQELSGVSLVVDDIIDSGNTLQAVASLLGVANTMFAAVTSKKHITELPITLQDRVIIGSYVDSEKWIQFPWEK